MTGLVADAKNLITADGKKAEMDLDTSKLDPKALKRWEENPDLLAILDQWMLVPDADLLAQADEIAARVQAIQKFKLPELLYRGFRPHYNAQDSMGLREKSFFFNRVREHKAGDYVEYQPERPLSFSTELRIARAFGTTVVALKSASIGKHYIPISNEASYLVGERRNHTKHKTQAEVIVLPTAGTLKVQVLCK